jgi:hypothetical protein
MDFERLGSFYLGKEFDRNGDKLLDRPFMYDARDLTTHAVCVGMTGSGKTGLCIDLLEEAAIDRVPAIIIDPKGDISNLLLTFPDLNAEDFLPWVNVDDARRKGLSVEQHAAGEARLWKKGLADWGQDGKRIKLLKDAADFVVYTPGSSAGVPVSILQSFTAPALDWTRDAEIIRERIQGTVGALLGLIGIEADPMRSREHILLANLFEHFWKQGLDLTLPALIMAVQNPPVRKLGVFDVDVFYPEKDRFELSMILNGLVAAPGFRSWTEGQPLDIAGFLATPEGKCRHSVFSIAHLSDAERMFFVTMLLNQVVTWIRSQPGTTSLRALLYMDEIFGFFPPVASPPSKKPLLTLLKQARAYGLGLVLTTQNPADLDYKGLGNTGTWFVGKLQTERDKARLLDGMVSSSTTSGKVMDRSSLSDRIAQLGSRTFLLHNIHDAEPVTFQTRWAMSYLRGPLTRRQIRLLMEDRAPDDRVTAPLAATAIAPPSTPQVSIPAVGGLPTGPAAGGAPPHLPPGIRQGFLPLRVSAGAASLRIEEEGGGTAEILSRRLVYRPNILGTGRVHFTDRRRKVDEEEVFSLMAPPPTLSASLRWEDATTLDPASAALAGRTEGSAAFETPPETINEVKEFKVLEKELKDHLYRSSAIELLHSRAARIYSAPREPEREFRLRLTQVLREMRDREVDKLNRRYAGRLRRLGTKIGRAEETLARRETVAKSRKSEVLVSIGESLLGAFMGRRSMRAASSTLSKYRMSKTASMSIADAEKAVAASQREITAIEEELRQKAAEITLKWDEAADKVERVPVTPRRTDIDLDFFGLAWAPHWQITWRDGSGRTRTDHAPAF